MKLFKGIKDIYRLDKATYKDIALAMDFINEYTIKCYCGYIDGEADPYKIQEKLYTINKNLNSVVFQFAVQIMILQGFINTVQVENEPDAIKSFRYTKQGIEKYFKGGFVREIKKSQREKWLMITGQISIILAGGYYLIEILHLLLS